MKRSAHSPNRTQSRESGFYFPACEAAGQSKLYYAPVFLELLLHRQLACQVVLPSWPIPKSLRDAISGMGGSIARSSTPLPFRNTRSEEETNR
jgi:hypothetical protein